MFFVNSVRVAPGVRSALALACGVALSASEVAMAQSAVSPVVVTATRQAVGVTELLSDVTVIERAELDQAGASTIEEVLSRQPGIQFASNGGPGALSSVFIRGTNSSHVVLLIDGMRAGSVTAGGVSWWRVPVSQIERIEIVRGPVSSLYGSDAIGGVIQIFTRGGQGPLSVTADAGVGSQGTAALNAGLSGSQAGWRYALNVGRFRTSGINVKPTSPSPMDADRDGFSSKSVTGRLSYELAKGHELGFSYFRSEGENQYDGYGYADVDHRNQTRVSSVSAFLNNRLSANWSSQLRLSRSTDDAGEYAGATQSSRVHSSQTQLSWQNDVHTQVGTFLLGAERLEDDVDASSTYVETSRAMNSLLAGWRGTYRAHSLQANVRHDDSTQFGDQNTGSLAYGYRFNPQWRLSATYGTGFKAPTFNDLYFPLECYGLDCYGGNPALQPETSRNRETTLHFEQQGHHVSLTWYLNQVDNLIVWGNTPENVAKARLEGLTLTYAGQLAGWNVQASYDYLDAKDQDTGERLAKRARHHAAVSLGRRVGPWEGRLEWQGSDRRVEYPYMSPAVKLSGYSLAHVYGAYHLNAEWSVFARVNNLFNRAHELTKGYATPGINTFIGVRYAPR
ncbi:MAG: TonB-dependent receptor [Aquabacterium sp.]|nr:MAG: TonB-dependent receptor [Aquabacterium sp.]